MTPKQFDQWKRDAESSTLPKRQARNAALVCALIALLCLGLLAKDCWAQELAVSQNAGASLEGCTGKPCAAELRLLATSDVVKRPSRSLKPLAFTFSAAAAGDVILTRAALRTGHAREQNPMYQGSALRMVAIKSAGTGGVLYAAWSLRKTHPKAATWLLVVATVGQVAIDVQNIRTLRAIR